MSKNKLELSENVSFFDENVNWNMLHLHIINNDLRSFRIKIDNEYIDKMGSAEESERISVFREIGKEYSVFNASIAYSDYTIYEFIKNDV